MKINNNIQALNAYRNLYQNQFSTSKNLERLSSGLRINRAADDAAGLAISEKMRSQIRGLKQAERNSLDGVSLMQVAEGAMTEVHSMLQRMRELSVQAANDTNTLNDRQAIQLEVDELLKEIDSIAAKTEFNTRKLLDGSSAVDTQFVRNEMSNTNIKGVPVVTDPSIPTGRYQIGIEGVPAPVLSYELNQPGAGVSNPAVLKIGPTPAIQSNGANLNSVSTNAELDYGKGYSIEVADKETEISNASFNETGDVTAVTVADDVSALPAGEYTVNVKKYDGSTSPATADIEITWPNGDIHKIENQDLTDFPVNAGRGLTLDGLNATGNGSVKFSLETTAEITVSSADGDITESVTLKDVNSQVTVGDFKVFVNSANMQNGTSTIGKRESDLGLGEYSIVVSDYQLDSDGKPSATIEVLDPDGFSVGKLAAFIGQEDGEIQSIGTEDGRAVMIDTSLITQAGTAKVQVEAKVKVAVSKVNDDNSTTAITFAKELTTRNGQVTHGGMEMEFGANVKHGESQFDLTNKALSFQIGANTSQNLNIDVPQLSTVKLGIDNLSVLSFKDANDSIFRVESAINQISAIRSKLGATQNRLEHSINNLQVTHENLTAAESRIRDADMALEMTEFTKNNILNQAAQAMLAQANQLPQGVLQLLQG